MMQRILVCITLCCLIQVAHAETEKNTQKEKVSGELIFLGRCGICHELPDPDALKPPQWKAVLKKMQKRMEFLGVPPLTDEENEKVYNWLSR